jgi:predicted DNA-binding transcriptional regulator AlpA
MQAETLAKLLVSYRELRELGITLSREHITRLVRQAKFPRPIRLGSDDQSAKAYWRYADILAWIDERAAVSDTLPTQRGNLPAARPSSCATDGSGPQCPGNAGAANGVRP